MPPSCPSAAGLPEPSGDGIWLLLQLLAPQAHRPLWEAVSELQRELLANSPVGAEYKVGGRLASETADTSVHLSSSLPAWFHLQGLGFRVATLRI